MSNKLRFNVQTHAAATLAHLVALEKSLEETDLPAGLRYLVKLRVSQINGCAHCVGMHSGELRRLGETDRRLDRLVVWRDVSDFTAPERAALAWAEALTRLDRHDDLEALHAALHRHFDDTQVAALSTVVASINLWNRLQIGAQGGGLREAA